MNDGHPIEETRPHEVSDDLNLRRRRLLRGAIGIAPVVLTLRSGAVAAVSSCTGAKLLTITDFQGKLASSSGVNTTDACITGYDTTGCPTDSGDKIRTGEGSIAVGGVTKKKKNGKYYYYCEGATSSPVAILSSSSASSFLGV
jgi:hypothetical protein